MMEFILAQQAQFWASMQKLEESQARHEESRKQAEVRLEKSQAKHEEWQKRAEVRIDNGSFRADRLERILKLMIKAGTRARRQIREQGVRSAEQGRHSAEQDQRWDQRFAELMQAQAHSDKKLAALIDVVRQQRNGST